MGPRPHLWFWAHITACLAQEYQDCMGPSPHLWFLDAKSRLLEQNNKLYGFQTWPVILCMKTNVSSTWNTTLWRCQPSSVVFGYKTATFGPELQVSMGPRPHLSFCACNTAWFPPEWQVYMGPRPHLTFCACNTSWFPSVWQVFMGSSLHLWLCGCKTATIGPDTQVCMGPRPHLLFCAHITPCLAQEQKGYISSCPHLWFHTCKSARLGTEILVPSTHLLLVHAKQGILNQNYKSLWVQDLTCRLCMQNSAICTRNTSLYGSQHSSVVFARKTSSFGPEIQVSMGPRPHLSFVHAKQRDLHQNYKSLGVPDMTCPFVHVLQCA